MKKILHLIGVVLLLSTLLTGCNGFTETQPNILEGTPANTPVEAPEETPIETPAETEEELPYKVDGRFETTSDEMDYYIKLAKYTQIGDVGLKSPFDIRITEFYGEFNGVCVVDLSIPGAIYMDSITYETIDGYVFVYSSSDKHDVYNSNDGLIYTLKKAYENGFLTLDDIKVIYEKHVKANARFYDFNDSGEVVGPTTPQISIGADGYWYINGVNTWVKAGSSTN